MDTIQAVFVRRPVLRLACLQLLLVFLSAGLAAGTVSTSQGESEARQRTVIEVKRVERAPQLEDFLSMDPESDVARSMTRIENFTQWIPRDGAPASQRTVAFIGYDDKHFYVVFLCFDDEPEKIRARLSRREDIFRDDRVDIFIDTFNDERRAYGFTVNPYGVQADANWIERETNQYDRAFDTVWQSAGQLTDRGYVLRVAIPFRSLRFPNSSKQTWGLLLSRFIPRVNEGSFWPYLTSRIEGRLNQAAVMTGIEGISPGLNLQFIPYGFYRGFEAIDTRDEPEKVRDLSDPDLGIDSKLVLLDSFVLDLTLNPDFNQIESDEPQVTVNERFEVFFPENRPFFLENASFFQTPMNLFFTRRIADPQFGIRLSGKRGPWAVGTLFADDQSVGKSVSTVDPLAGSRAYYGVLRVNRDLGRQSTLGAIFTNRSLEEAYNRVGGIDGRFKLTPNWVSSFQAVTAATRYQDGDYAAGPAYDAALQRAGRKLSYTLEFNDRSPGFQTLTGFLPGPQRSSSRSAPSIRRILLRPDIRSARQFISYRFRPEGETLIAFGPDININPTWDHSWKPLDTLYSLDWRWELSGQTYLGIFYRGLTERLKPENFEFLPPDPRYASTQRGFSWNTNFSRLFGLQGEFSWGTAINLVPPEGTPPVLGNATEGNVGFTLYPTYFLRVEGTYILSRLLERSNESSVFNNHIARTKVSWQFSREASARMILQYNSILANPENSSLETDRNFNADFLFTYQVNAWTAFYAGANTNFQNFALVRDDPISRLIRVPDLRNDSWQFFVKYSHFFDF